VEHIGSPDRFVYRKSIALRNRNDIVDGIVVLHCQLSQKIKLIGNCKFNYLINIVILLFTCGAKTPLQQVMHNTLNIYLK
jgi:hypothetical protein